MLEVTEAVAMGKLLAFLKFSQSFQQQCAGLNAFYQYCWNEMFQVQTHGTFPQVPLNINSMLPSYSTVKIKIQFQMQEKV